MYVEIEYQNTFKTKLNCNYTLSRPPKKITAGEGNLIFRSGVKYEPRVDFALSSSPILV